MQKKTSGSVIINCLPSQVFASLINSGNVTASLAAGAIIGPVLTSRNKSASSERALSDRQLEWKETG